MSIVDAIYIFSSIFMLGLIWVIQLVHYPSFLFVDNSKFVNFEKFHSQKITYIVMPMMIAEIVSCSMIVVRDYWQGDGSWFWMINMISLLGIWLSTFCLSIPCHAKLRRGYCHTTIKRLIDTNWPRTFLWTVKGCLVICWMCGFV